MKWEYKHLVTDTFTEGAAMLNSLGDDGWELVAVCKTERKHAMFILKRPKSKAPVKKKVVKAPSRK